MRKERGHFHLDASPIVCESSKDYGEDPVVDLVNSWIVEFQCCVCALADGSSNPDYVREVNERLSHLERRICIVINEKDNKRVCLISKAHTLVKSLSNMRSRSATSSPCDLGCSVDTLETLYKERTFKSRGRFYQRASLDPRALRAIEAARLLSPEQSSHHLVLRRMKISDLNANELLLGSESVEGFQQVESVDLSQNRLSSTSVLFELLQVFSNTQFLDLRGNRFAEASDVLNLAKYVSERPNFIGVDIRGNLINISILSTTIWFHLKRLPANETATTFLQALGKIAITNNKTCKDILP